MKNVIKTGLFAFVLAMSLSACGGAEEATTESTTETTEETVAPADSTEAAAPAEATHE